MAWSGNLGHIFFLNIKPWVLCIFKQMCPVKDHIPHTYMNLQWACLQLVIVVVPDHTGYFVLSCKNQ